MGAPSIKPAGTLSNWTIVSDNQGQTQTSSTHLDETVNAGGLLALVSSGSSESSASGERGEEGSESLHGEGRRRVERNERWSNDRGRKNVGRKRRECLKKRLLDCLSVGDVDDLLCSNGGKNV